MEHSFDIQLAKQYGIEEALLIRHFQHWIMINYGNDRNFKDGRRWTYQTRKEISSHFPYLNEDSVKWTLNRLISLGILITHNYNKCPIDKTLWYTFVHPEKFGVDEESLKNLYERRKHPSMVVNTQAIPDTKTTYIKEKEREREKESPSEAKVSDFLSSSFLFEKIKKSHPDLEMSEQFHQSTLELLKTHTNAQLEAIVDWAYLDPFWLPKINSAQILRKHIETIKSQMKAKSKKKVSPPIPPDPPEPSKKDSIKREFNQFIEKHWNLWKQNNLFMHPSDTPFTVEYYKSVTDRKTVFIGDIYAPDFEERFNKFLKERNIEIRLFLD